MTNPDTQPADAIDLTRVRNFALGKIAVHPSASEIVADGATHRVEPRVMQLLVALAQAEGQVVSRSTLMTRCWHGAFVSEDALTRAVGRARQLCRLSPGDYRIETIPKIGYRLIVDSRTATQQQGPFRVPPNRRRMQHAAITLTAILAAAAGSLFLLSSAPLEPSQAAANESVQLLNTADEDAHDKYVRAGGLLEAGGRDNLLRAEQLLREAIDLDPGFHLASERLAAVLFAAATYAPERAAAMYAEISDIIETQSADTPLAWRSHLILGFRDLFVGDWLSADQHLAQARAAAPSAAADTIDSLAIRLHGSVGRINESLPLVERQARGQPLSRENSRALQQWLNQTGMSDAAEAEYVRSFDLPGDRAATELTALMRALGTADPLIVHERSQRYLATDWARAGDAALAEMIDSAPDALELIRAQIDAWPTEDAMPPHLAAAWAAYFGDHDLAVHALRSSPDLLFRVSVMLWEPVFAETRRTAAFTDMLREFGYDDYWRSINVWGDFCSALGPDEFECR